MEDKRLNNIDKKVDRLIALMEGIHGSEGLVTQIQKNKQDIADLRKLQYKAIGVLSVIVPISTLLIRSLL